MKKRLKKIGQIIIFFLPLTITALITNFIINNQSNKTKKIDLNNTTTASPTTTTNSASIKQESSGQYSITEGDHSAIKDAGSGALYGFSSPDNKIEFVVSSSATITATTNSQGYKIRKLSEVDPLWDPGSCAQKPSLEFANRYIMISELNGYNFYDTMSKKYKSFGLSDAMESLYVVDGENNTMIMYMYAPKKGGKYNQDNVITPNNNFIIRRTVNLDNFSYIDYKITITNLGPNTSFIPSIIYDGNRKLTLVLRNLGSDGIVNYYDDLYWANLSDLAEIDLLKGSTNSKSYIDQFTVKPGVYNIDKENTIDGKIYSITDFTVPTNKVFILGAFNI